MSNPNPFVLINPHARRGRKGLALLRPQLEPIAKEIVVTADHDEMRRCLLDWRDREAAPEIWVGGGDGTVRESIEHLAGSSATVGLLPLGTGNALALDLGVPTQPQAMVPFLLDRSVVRPIDVGMFNDHVFVTIATIGVTSGVAKSLKGVNKGLLGKWVYLPALVKAIYLARPFTVHLGAEGTSRSVKALQVVVANGSFHGGSFAVTESASLTDGKLSTYVVESSQRRALLRYGMALLRGKHTQMPEVWSAELPDLHLRLNRPRTFVLDGDLFKVQEVTLKVWHKAVQMRCSPNRVE